MDSPTKLSTQSFLQIVEIQTQPEIYEFYLLKILIYDYILKFYIAMSHTQPMKIVNRMNEISKNIFYLIVLQFIGSKIVAQGVR